MIAEKASDLIRLENYDEINELMVIEDGPGQEPLRRIEEAIAGHSSSGIDTIEDNLIILSAYNESSRAK